MTEGWVAIPSHFVQTRLHAFVLMPNYVHGIIEIVPQAGAHRNSPQVIEDKPKVARGSLGAIVRSFKAAVSKRAREELRWTGEVWQRNYFERVLRDEQEFADASAYIKGNIKRWGLLVIGAPTGEVRS